MRIGGKETRKQSINSRQCLRLSDKENQKNCEKRIKAIKRTERITRLKWRALRALRGLRGELHIEVEFEVVEHLFAC